MISDITHPYWEYFFGDGYDVYIFTVRAQTKNSLPVVEFFITDRNGDMPPQTLVIGNNTFLIPGATLYIGDGLKVDGARASEYSGLLLSSFHRSL